MREISNTYSHLLSLREQGVWGGEVLKYMGKESDVGALFSEREQENKA